MNLHREIKIGELVRHIQSRDMFLVTHKTTQGLFVVNIMDRQSPKMVYLILPSQMDEWARDNEIIDLNEVEAVIVESQMDLIESIG